MSLTIYKVRPFQCSAVPDDKVTYEHYYQSFAKLCQNNTDFYSCGLECIVFNSCLKKAILLEVRGLSANQLLTANKFSSYYREHL